MTSRFSNYLRANRKRLALSQGDVAFLLGAQSGAKVSRYEQFAREPNLKTALAYQVVCQRPVSELFQGLYHEIEQEVAIRAHVLASQKQSHSPSQERNHQLEILEALATSTSE